MIPVVPAASKILVAAHVHSNNHRTEIESSPRCACFFCFKSFANTEVTSWTDTNKTAICPKCGVDAVLGSASGIRLDTTFLRDMHRHYFATRAR